MFPIQVRQFAFVALTLGFLCVAQTQVVAHEFADGFIERGIAIQVRDRVMHIDYSIGLSPATMQALIQEWDGVEVTTKPKQIKNQDDDLPPRPRISNFTEQEIQELETRFSRFLQDELANRMEVEIAGERVPASSISVEVAPRHHVNSVVKLQVQLPEGQQLKLVVNDPTFDQYDGAIRTALKAKGQAMILNSNVAPILVRAKRLDLTNLSPNQKASLSKIEVQLGFRPAKDKN